MQLPADESSQPGREDWSRRSSAGASRDSDRRRVAHSDHPLHRADHMPAGSTYHRWKRKSALAKGTWCHRYLVNATNVLMITGTQARTGI